MSCPVPSSPAQSSFWFPAPVLVPDPVSSWAFGKWSVQKCHRRRHRHRRRPCPLLQLPTCPPPIAAAATATVTSCISQPASKQTQQVSARTLLTKQDLGLFLSLARRCPTVDQSRAYPAPPRATTLDDATVRYAALPRASSLPYLTLPDCYLTLPCTHAGSSLCPVQLHYYIPLTVCLLQT